MKVYIAVLLGMVSSVAFGSACSGAQTAVVEPNERGADEGATAPLDAAGEKPQPGRGGARLRIDRDEASGEVFYRITPDQGGASKGRFQIHATTIGGAGSEPVKEIQLGLSIVGPGAMALPCNWLGFVAAGKVVAGKAETFKRLLPPLGTPVVTYAVMVPVETARALAASTSVKFLLCKKRVVLNAADTKLFRNFLNALSN
jgi:hypothetical protein